MNKIYSLLIAFAAVAITFTSCKDEEPFATASEDDFPQILLPWFGEWEDGVPGEYKNISRDIEYVDSVTVTPARYTTVEWFIDGEKVNEGTRYNRYFKAGNYTLKIVATTTKGLSTSRTGRIIVRPLLSDPIFDDVAEERLVAPGITATLTGMDLGDVKKLIIGGKEATIVSVSRNQIVYIVPSLEDGNYAVEVVDDNMTYGGVYTTGENTYENMNILVTKAPYVSKNELNSKAGRDVTLTGLNLHNIKSITIGGIQATIKSQSSTELTFTCPKELENGDYELVVATTDGSEVNFNGSNTCTISVASAIVLWEGNLAIDWVDPEIGDVHAKLKELAQVGSTLRLYVTETEATYHMACAVVDWCGILTGKGDPDRGDSSVSGTQVIEYVLNSTSINMIKNGGKFSVVGFGCKLTKITIEDPDEITIYEGPSEKTAWSGVMFGADQIPSLGIKIGSTITAYLTADEGAIGAIATTWWNKINSGDKWEAEGEVIKTELPAGKCTLQYNVATMNYLNEQGLGIIGNGFVVDRITVK